MSSEVPQLAVQLQLPRSASPLERSGISRCSSRRPSHQFTCTMPVSSSIDKRLVPLLVFVCRRDLTMRLARLLTALQVMHLGRAACATDLELLTQPCHAAGRELQSNSLSQHRGREYGQQRQEPASP